MAAYAALVSVARTLDECCNATIVPLDLDQGGEEIFNSLLQRFIFLQTFLENFPEGAENLEGQIRDVAYRAEDLLDYFMLSKQLRSHKASSFGDAEKLRAYYESAEETISEIIVQNFDPNPYGETISESAEEESSSNIQATLIQLLRELSRDVHSIQEKVAKINNITGVRDLMKMNDYSSESPPPRTSKDIMVGFDDQLMAIKSKLHELSRKQTVIPIFGMGGIGKTTLARNAFDDRLTKMRFDLHAWATVSQTYSVREIFLNLLISCKVLNEKTNNESIVRLKQLMYKSLKGRRYLIVLDDVWSVTAWDEVSTMFPDDNNGSRVMLTTRMLEVAKCVADGSSASNSYFHSMQFLDEEQSWNLLQEKVFNSSIQGQSYSCPPELEEIGKQIAKRCGGLPLTIVVTAGILQSVSRTKAAWMEIARKVINVVVAQSRDERVVNVLSLSYKYLPHHLRPCFLYMAAFPKDDVIDVSNLLKIWIAEGFLKPSTQYKCFEETAEEYLEDLVRRSLILVEFRNIISGKIMTCSIHDLLWDMCIRKAREELFLQHVGRSSYVKQRRVSTNNRLTYYPPNIRTFLSFKKIDNNDNTSDDAYNRTFPIEATTSLLRVIHAPHISFTELPTVLHLFHLRYLYIINCKEMPLTEDIYKLKKIQTLVLPSADTRLPFNIWKMPQLRHLEVHNLRLPPFDVETNFTILENLQTLSSLYNLVCTEMIMQSMPNLKELKLHYEERDLLMFQFENLVHLHQLEKLTLYVYPMINVAASSSEKLVLPTTLRELYLTNCMLAWEKLGCICSSLPNLEVLHLSFNGCYGEVWETEEGQFPQLKELKLMDHSDLKHWITESSHFPRLEHLSLLRCREPLEIPSVMGEIPTLQLITVEGGRFRESLVDSAKQIVSEQQEMGNNDLQLEIYGYGNKKFITVRDLQNFIDRYEEQ